MVSHRLDNVTVVRNVLIVLLVFYHAFAIYSGAWPPINGFPEIRVYWWLDKLSYAFMLELFVFISGYVFGYQVRMKGGSRLQAKTLFESKFKRLMVPCMVFSLLYIFMYGTITQPIYRTAYDLLNGVGHMWFLPMLFWCFLGVWIFEKIQFKHQWAIALLIFASICSFLPLPLRMSVSMYYMLFFYVGYIIQRNTFRMIWLYAKHSAIITSISFIVLFFLLTLLKERVGIVQTEGGGNQFVTKIVVLSLQRVFQLIYAFAGIFMTLSLVDRYLKRHTMPKWMEKVSSLSFGVYLFQQFILKGLYNYTTLPFLLGCYWLPWVGFVIALIGSLLIAFLLRKTMIGQMLIG